MTGSISLKKERDKKTPPALRLYKRVKSSVVEMTKTLNDHELKNLSKKE